MDEADLPTVTELIADLVAASYQTLDGHLRTQLQLTANALKIDQRYYVNTDRVDILARMCAMIARADRLLENVGGLQLVIDNAPIEKEAEWQDWPSADQSGR